MADPKFKLIVSYSGLCGFVPKIDKSGVWVLMVDESAPRVPKIRPHKAFLRFNLLDVFGSDGENTPKGIGLWDLSKFNLSIVTGNPSPMPVDISGYQAGNPPADDSFLHVASIEDAAKKRGFPGAGSVRPELVSEKMEFAEGESLAARMLIKEGRLKVGTLAAGEDAEHRLKFAVFRFRPFEGSESGEDHRQLVASEVILETDIYTEYVEIQAKKFGEKDVFDVLRLSPPDKDKDVFIFIMNEEGEQVVGTSRRKNLRLKKARHQDRIFNSFYRLASIPPPAGEAPIPVADYLTDRGKPAIAMSAPPCSPGRFSEI